MKNRTDIDKAIDYSAYKALAASLFAQGKTTGHEQTEEKIRFTGLNLQRMQRVEKTFVPAPETQKIFEKIQHHFYWIVLTEAWCGDAAQSLPVIHKLSELNSNISLRILIRDDNPAVMDQYLTNGARSIPVLICADENLQDQFVWGPRPAPLQQLAMQLVKDKMPKDEKGLIIQKWYNADQARTIQDELCRLVTTKMYR